MGLIVLITFGNVLARYFTSQSFAATEVLDRAADRAVLLVRRRPSPSIAHTSGRFLRPKLPPGLHAFVDWLSFAVTASLFAFIAFYAGKAHLGSVPV